MKHQDRVSVEESRELLAEYMRTLVERASQSGCHLECITGARKALDAMVPLMNAAMESGISNFSRFVFHHRSISSYPDHQLEHQKKNTARIFFLFQTSLHHLLLLFLRLHHTSFPSFPASLLRFWCARLLIAAA